MRDYSNGRSRLGENRRGHSADGYGYRTGKLKGGHGASYVFAPGVTRRWASPAPPHGAACARGATMEARRSLGSGTAAGRPGPAPHLQELEEPHFPRHPGLLMTRRLGEELVEESSAGTAVARSDQRHECDPSGRSQASRETILL